MAAKKTTVLVVSEAGATQVLEFEHAERLLRMPRSGWKLPEDSPYEFKDNALYRRGNKRKDSEK